jgi:hypothetical protein
LLEQRGHALVSPDAAAGADVVGIFDDRHGRAQALIRVTPPGGPSEPVELDDIVLGYLAEARDAGSGAAA